MNAFFNCVYYVFRFIFRISKIVASVSKKEIPDHVRAIVLEICCNDGESNDIEVPYVKYNLPALQK